MLIRSLFLMKVKTEQFGDNPADQHIFQLVTPDCFYT